MPLFVFFGVIAVILLYLITLYNALVSIKHMVSKCWANIDVALKQRHDEIPKLVEVCRQYAQFEQATLIRVMEARNAVAESARRHDMKQLGSNESKLRSLFAQLNAVVEAYPETRADEQFGRLSERITTLEANLVDRRELYNEAVNINNARIEQFPDVLIARLFDFKPSEPLHFSAEEKKDVDIAALFKQA